jgi:hypothetical protein
MRSRAASIESLCACLGADADDRFAIAGAAPTRDNIGLIALSGA